MKQPTRYRLTKLTLLWGLVWICSQSSSFVNCTSTYSTRNKYVYEDSGGGQNNINLLYKSSFSRNKRDVENTELEMSPRVSSLNKIKSSQKSISNYLQYLAWRNSKDAAEDRLNDNMHLSRKKREGFFDLSEVPRMMVHMVQGLTHGLPSMVHSMMNHGHQMVSHFMPAKPTTVHHTPSISFGKPVASRPSHSSSSGSYKSQGPNIIYGEWTPIGSSFKPKPRPAKPVNNYHPPLNNHISSGPIEKPKPVFINRPQPTFTKPRPIYVKPQPAQPPPSFSKPTIQYRPVPLPPQPATTSIVSEHFGAPQPQEEKDSYGTPIGNPVGPTNPTAPSIDFNQPSFSSEVNNPFTQPPYQTTFTATPSEPIVPHTTEPSFAPLDPSKEPLTGTFVDSNKHHHNPSDPEHKYVEEWSDDINHIKPIADNTLYYNDLLRVKFKKKHDDGRKKEHAAVKAKEHHRVEKSVPSRGHETSSLDQTTNQYPNFPSFPSLPTLSGAFQLHHLPPISAASKRRYRKRKTVPTFQRIRSLFS